MRASVPPSRTRKPDESRGSVLRPDLLAGLINAVVSVPDGLSGVDEEVSQHLRRAGKLDLEGAVRLLPAADDLGASTRQAVADARAWLGSAHSDPPVLEKDGEG